MTAFGTELYIRRHFGATSGAETLLRLGRCRRRSEFKFLAAFPAELGAFFIDRAAAGADISDRSRRCGRFQLLTALPAEFGAFLVDSAAAGTNETGRSLGGSDGCGNCCCSCCFLCFGGCLLRFILGFDAGDFSLRLSGSIVMRFGGGTEFHHFRVSSTGLSKDSIIMLADLLQFFPRCVLLSSDL